MRERGGEGFLGVRGLLAHPRHGPWAAEQLLPPTPVIAVGRPPDQVQGRGAERESRADQGTSRCHAARWLTDRREVLGCVCGPESRFSDDGRLGLFRVPKGLPLAHLVVQTHTPYAQQSPPLGEPPISNESRGHLEADNHRKCSRPEKQPCASRAACRAREVPSTRQDDDTLLDKCARKSARRARHQRRAPLGGPPAVTGRCLTGNSAWESSERPGIQYQGLIFFPLLPADTCTMSANGAVLGAACFSIAGTEVAFGPLCVAYPSDQPRVLLLFCYCVVIGVVKPSSSRLCCPRSHQMVPPHSHVSLPHWGCC